MIISQSQVDAYNFMSNFGKLSMQSLTALESFMALDGYVPKIFELAGVDLDPEGIESFINNEALEIVSLSHMTISDL